MAELVWENEATVGAMTTSSGDAPSTPPTVVSKSGAAAIDVVNSGLSTGRPNHIRFAHFVNTNCFARWTLPAGSWSQYRFRFYYQIAATPGGNATNIIGVRNAADTDWVWMLRIDTSRLLRLWEGPSAGPTLRGTSGSALSINTTYRIEGSYSGTTLTIKFYAGESTTATNTFTATIAAHTPLAFALYAYATISTTHPNMFFDDIKWVDGTGADIGPWAAPSTGTIPNLGAGAITAMAVGSTPVTALALGDVILWEA